MDVQGLPDKEIQFYVMFCYFYEKVKTYVCMNLIHMN